MGLLFHPCRSTYFSAVFHKPVAVLIVVVCTEKLLSSWRMLLLKLYTFSAANPGYRDAHNTTTRAEIWFYYIVTIKIFMNFGPLLMMMIAQKNTNFNDGRKCKNSPVKRTYLFWTSKQRAVTAARFWNAKLMLCVSAGWSRKTLTVIYGFSSRLPIIIQIFFGPDIATSK